MRTRHTARRHLLHPLAVSLALSLLPCVSACGALDEVPTPGLEASCAHPTYCDDYYGLTTSNLSTQRDRCPSVDIGKWSEATACPRAGMIGGCRYTVAEVPGYRVEWYQTSWGPRQAAQLTCQGFGGTFVDAGAVIK